MLINAQHLSFSQVQQLGFAHKFICAYASFGLQFRIALTHAHELTVYIENKQLKQTDDPWQAKPSCHYCMKITTLELILM